MKAIVLNERSSKRPPLSDVKDLRERARQHIEKGAVTSGYAADRKEVLSTLNEALATELVCVLRYKRHHFMAAGIHAAPVAAEFLAHALSNFAASRTFPRTDLRSAVMRSMSRAIRSRA
jgi:hypothetical protein